MSPMSPDQRVHRQIANLIGAVLNREDALPQLVFRPSMAGLARPIDVQHGASDMMVADLQRAFALIRHVAIGAGDA
jgi:hypothetical protein